MNDNEPQDIAPEHKIISSTKVSPYLGHANRYCAICGKPATVAIYDGQHTTQYACAVQLHQDLVRAALGGVTDIDLSAGGLVVEDVPAHYVSPAAVTAPEPTWEEIRELRRRNAALICGCALGDDF